VFVSCIMLRRCCLVVVLYNASLGNFTFFGEFFGVDNNDRAGFSVGIGDFNNDSFDDFVLGANTAVEYDIG